jgi:quercetin dioxygenase-like cupin family protein
VGRGAVGPYETGPGAFQFDGQNVQLDLKNATDVAVVHGAMAPGGTLGWHSHPDVVFVTITEADMTLYNANDPSCTPYVVHAGEAFVERPGLVHTARNESTTGRVSSYAAHIGVPSGPATTIDEPDPGTRSKCSSVGWRLRSLIGVGRAIHRRNMASITRWSSNRIGECVGDVLGLHWRPARPRRNIVRWAPNMPGHSQRSKRKEVNRRSN